MLFAKYREMCYHGKMNFGTHLKYLRLEAGLSVQEAARKAAISPSYWYDLEGRGFEPTLSKALRIATALGVDIDTLTKCVNQ